jgi:hypothetical protein
VARLASRVLSWVEVVRLCDNGKPAVAVYSDKTMIVCDEKRRAELIQQRERLLEAESQGKTIEVNGHEAKAPAPAALPAPETQPNANVGTGNGTVTQNQPPVVQKDPLILKMQSIGRAESWKSEENHAGSFGPYPEEYEWWKGCYLLYNSPSLEVRGGWQYDATKFFRFGSELRYDTEERSVAVIPQIWLVFPHEETFKVGYFYDFSGARERFVRMALVKGF